MSVIGNLNYLKNVFRHPCGTDNYVVMVEMAFPAAALTFYELLAWGCTDIVKMRIGKSPWHNRALRGLIKSATPMLPLGSNSFMVAIGYSAIEAGLWYWLVADALTAFLPRWMSMVYQEEKCTEPGRGYIETTANVGFCGPGTINEVPPGGVDSKSCMRFNGHGVVVKSGCYATITYEIEAIDFRPEIFGNGIARFYLRDQDGNKTAHSGVAIEEGHFTGLCFGGINRTTGAFASDREYRLIMEVDQGVVGTASGKIRVSAYGLPYDLVGMGCKPKPQSYPWG